jgi:Protein kinase domain
MDEDATRVLLALATHEISPGDPRRGRHALDGDRIVVATQLDADRINDAVALLDDSGYVEVHRYIGTAPFDFGDVELTARGRREAERIAASDAPSPGIVTGRQANRRYVVGARIGEGALGEVWRATDTQLRRDVAIKFIHEGGSSEDALAQARAVARVMHPNIVVVHEVTCVVDPATEAPADAIVMELVHGRSLNELVRYAIPVPEVRRVGTALLDAIGAYHRAQLAHLDLHGENVMIGDATVKVIDPSCAQSDYFRSTATRERQYMRDVRDVRSLLVQMLHVCDGIPMQRVGRFECDTTTIDLAALRESFERLFVGEALPVTAPPEPAVHSVRQQYERVVAAVTNREVVIAGGVLDARDSRRNPVNGRIEVGRHDDLSFELRIPAGAGPGIPLLRVPWEALRLPSVDAAGRLALALTMRVQWDGRELQLVAP